MAVEKQRQLIIRCDPELIHQLKLIAAYHDVSMAEYVRVALSGTVESARKDSRPIAETLKAAKL